jgi:cytochrome P450 PksS
MRLSPPVTAKERPPPGPVNLASPEFKANPYPFYARLRAEAPVHRLTLPTGETAWLITRYDDAVTVLKDERFVKDPANALRPELAARLPGLRKLFSPVWHDMLRQDPPHHTRLRTLVHKAFTPQRIEQMRGRIQALADDLLDPVQGRGRMDVIRDYALPLSTTVIAEMLGAPAEDGRRFHRWSRAVVDRRSSTWGLLKAIPNVWAFTRYIRKIVKERRANPRDDLVSALVRAEEAGDALSEEELVAMIQLLLIAGHETTVNLIGNGTLALLEHPDQVARLRKGPALIVVSAVEELLRYTNPVQMAPERYPREDVALAGAVVPRGATVFVVIGSANRDERQFANPDVLDITREPNRHLAFGLGAHFCLGAALARLEGQIAIGTLLRRAPDLRLTVAPDRLRWRWGLVNRGLEALPLAFGEHMGNGVVQKVSRAGNGTS